MSLQVLTGKLENFIPRKSFCFHVLYIFIEYGRSFLPNDPSLVGEPGNFIALFRIQCFAFGINVVPDFGLFLYPFFVYLFDNLLSPEVYCSILLCS